MGICVLICLTNKLLHFDLRQARIGMDGAVKQESLPVSFYHQGTGKKIVLKRRRLITVD